MKVDERVNTWFEELVPDEGKATTVAGEIIRAFSRIGYRWYNDGDRIGIGYGNETCNDAARFLIEKCPKEFGDKLSNIWGNFVSDTEYEDFLCEASKSLMDWLETTDLKTTPNTDDMHDWDDPEDYHYDEEEDDYYEEDEYDEEDYDEEDYED